MAEPTSPAHRRRVHPLDLLVLVLAVALALIAYAYLFRQSPVPRPADPLLGAEITLEVEADREWKRTFPQHGTTVALEEFLLAEVLAAPAPVQGRPGTVSIRLRVLGRDHQRPEALTHFRGGVRRGTRVRMSDRESEVEAEVVAVEPAGGDG